MKSILFIAVATLFAGSIAQAANPVCNTLTECRALRSQVEARIQELEASIIGDFLRNSDGSVRTRINQYEAFEECKKLGKRLPTIRELAQEAVKFGAQIREVNEQVTDDFDMFTSKNDNKNDEYDKFYFSFKNYKRPTGDLGNFWIWSSSLYPAVLDYAFAFRGISGAIGDVVYRGLDHNYTAVRCAGSSSVER